MNSSTQRKTVVREYKELTVVEKVAVVVPRVAVGPREVLADDQVEDGVEKVSQGPGHERRVIDGHEERDRDHRVAQACKD